jgi:hypothetical protein
MIIAVGGGGGVAKDSERIALPDITIRRWLAKRWRRILWHGNEKRPFPSWERANETRRVQSVIYLHTAGEMLPCRTRGLLLVDGDSVTCTATLSRHW